jgi:hypothetical protein
MAWYLRLTKFASVHMVYKQEKVNSCGMASMMMINFKMKKTAMIAGFAAAAAVDVVPVIGKFVGETMRKAALDYAIKTEPYVYSEYTKVTGTPYDGTTYSNANHFPAVLRNLGLGEWECVNVGQAGMAAAIKAACKAGAPCITHTVWDKGGAHFCVVDDTFGDELCVNDPGDGDVHITKAPDGAAIKYDNAGTMSGWIVRRK